MSEIFMVVAGILIALSINSWTTKKSQRNDDISGLIEEEFER